MSRRMSKLSFLTCTVGLVALAVAFASCGSSESESLVAPCDGIYAGRCGRACSETQPCPSGLYCGSDSTCTADCGPGARRCPAPQTCTSDGRCTEMTDAAFDGLIFDGPGVDSAGQSDGTGDACGEVTVTTEPVIPNVMLLVDQSGSMEDAFGGGMNRWEAAYDALMAPSQGVVAQLEGSVRFGLTLYTSHGGNLDGGTCPELVKVPIGLNNYAAIDAIYSAESPQSDTPTGESIDAILPDVLGVNEAGPKIIVLATDGEPDTCAVPNPQSPEARVVSVEAAQAANAAGVDIYVISVGDQVGQAHLQEMANAGVGLPIDAANGAPYYVANNPAELKAAFEKIVTGVIGCVFKLNGEVQSGMEGQGIVSLDGQSVPHNDPNGWRLNDPGEIELLGASCDLLTDGRKHSLVVRFPCGAVVIMPR